MALGVGDAAPDFELPWTGDGDFKLSDRRGGWVVLAFYPGDETAVCTRQLCQYRDAGDELTGLDAEIVGISPQGVESHQAFIANHNLNIPLIADEAQEAAAAYDVKFGPRTRRAIFIVDPEGKVRHADVKKLGLTFTDSEGITEALAAAQATTA